MTTWVGAVILDRSGEAAAGMVHTCGRAPLQGRGLFQNRHIAHPNLPAPFSATNSQWTGKLLLLLPGTLTGLCPPLPAYSLPGSVHRGHYVGQWHKPTLL